MGKVGGLFKTLSVLPMCVGTDEPETAKTELFFYKLPIDVFAMVNIKKDRPILILEIKQNPVSAGDAERESVSQAL